MSWLVMTTATATNPEFPDVTRIESAAVARWMVLFTRIPHQLQGNARLAFITHQFLSKPYYFGALGEGVKGNYDQYPRYRDDRFDCLSFVETTLALTLAKNINSVKQHLAALRYANAQNDYVMRNHFMSSEWNPNNQRKGYIKDITDTIHDPQGHPIYRSTETTISFQGFIAHKTPEELRLPNPSLKELRYQQLRQRARLIPDQTASMRYLALSDLFDREQQPNNNYFSQIPNGSLVEIVRINWPISHTIGTNLLVSHLGWVFRDHKSKLIYREASSLQHQVVDAPLVDYLKGYLNHSSVAGIAIFAIQYPNQP